MANLIDIQAYPINKLLSRLLQDKTTKQNIIFATDAYADCGEEYGERQQITEDKLLGFGKVRIVPRVEKAAEEQLLRTRKKAEVFTPSWIVNRMNNHCDAEWFGRQDVFNTEDGVTWITTPGSIPFDKPGDWKKYVDSRRIEITCGEAPYIVSRYDTTTGELIPIENRIGILDRKMRVINENAQDDQEWLKWAMRAFQSVYGYEFQGDNLLIARINTILTFMDYYSARFNDTPELKLLQKYANIVCWNFWQMDGITGTIPFAIKAEPEEDPMQITLFEFMGEAEVGEDTPDAPLCKIWDWRKENAVSYDSIRGGSKK